MALRDTLAVEFPDSYIAAQGDGESETTLTIEDQGDGVILVHFRTATGAISLPLEELEEGIAFLAGRIVGAKK